MMATNYSFGIERDDEVLKKNDLDHRKWTNPLEIRYSSTLFFMQEIATYMPPPWRLPDAPTTRFICVYGQGKETEVCVV